LAKATEQEPVRDDIKLFGYMIGAALFFAVTLLTSFFVIIVAINQMDIPGDVAPNFFMIGLVPPSIATTLIFTRVLGRLL
jgi:hypothetical protein